MKFLARLGTAAVALAYCEVLLGSWTRINRAGLTCPDYPLCHGKLIPPFAGGTIWEWTHRLVALALCIAVLTVIAIAWQRTTTRNRYARGTVILAGAFLLLQVILGALTVRLGNSPLSVVWHWAAAMALVASLAALAIFAAAPAESRVRGNANVATVLGIAAAIAFFTMCIGVYVSTSGAGLACVTIPGCAGNIVVYNDGQYVQMLHRAAAAATLIAAAIAFAFAWMRPVATRVRAWATAGLVLVFVQIVLGLLNVALRLPVDLREAHSANAALIFLAFVCATICAAFDPLEASERAIA